MSRLITKPPENDVSPASGVGFAVKSASFLRVTLFLMWGTVAAFCEPLELLPTENHDQWAAIGRVNVAGYNRRQMCTGTLISPDMVLTAAHCVLKPNLKPFQTKDIIFLAGWNRGSYSALGRAVGVTVHPSALHEGAINPTHDLALLHLASPLQVSPIPLARPDVTSDLALVGYFDRRPHMLSAAFDCNGKLAPVGLILDCGTRPGNSGGPVLSQLEGTWHLVSVVSAGNARSTIGAMLDNFVLP